MIYSDIGKVLEHYSRPLWSSLLFVMALALLAILNQTIADQSKPDELGADFWPRVWIFILLALTAVDAAVEFRHIVVRRPKTIRADLRPQTSTLMAAAEPDAVPAEDARLLVAGMAFVVCYVLATVLIGFALATPIFLTAFAYLGGYRQWLSLLIIAIATTLTLLYVFVQFVYISLPLGQGPFIDLNAQLYRILGNILIMLDVLSNLSGGFLQVFYLPHFAILVAGVVIGMTAGVLPGITGIMALILLLPITYKMAVTPALILLTSAYVGGVFGGTITAILFNIPGDPDSVPSLWDGHPMARAGHAGKALGIAAFSAVIGGLGGTLVLTFLSEPFARVALQFSSIEYFSVVVFGLTSVTVLGSGSLRAALISLIIGLLIGTIGLDDIYGQERFTFGSAILRDGVDFQVVLMGVYALAEVLERLSRHYPAANITEAANAVAKLPGIRELLRLWPTLSRATITGMVIGIIPGAGATIGAFVAYGTERLFARRRHLLGTGIPEGLAAPNAAANATIGGHFIPLLTLGIPGSGATAVILGAFLIKGIQPGPNIFTTSSELVYAIFATQYIALVVMLIATYLSVGLYVKILRVPESIIAAMIIVFTFLGSYSLRSNMSDVWLMIGFGILGYLMRRFNFPVAPLVLGVILGPIAERHFMTAMISYHNDLTVFVSRPFSATFLALAVVIIMIPVLRRVLPSGKKPDVAAVAQD